MPNPHKMAVTRDTVARTLSESGISDPPLVRLLDYTIDLFESRGLGSDYYGYHNIYHELAVAYVVLLSASSARRAGRISKFDAKHMYAAALLHDFDPAKTVDKPHEKSVLNFIARDANIRSMISAAGMDMNIVQALILRTAHPWRGSTKRRMGGQAALLLQKSAAVGGDMEKREHYMQLGWHLSVADRIGGYAVGDFAYSMELAKMNAHALAWEPSLIVRRSVAYFEDLLNNESDMCQTVMGSLPRDLRKNFFNTVLSFMRLRTEEIAIQAEHTYDNLRFVPTIDSMETRGDPRFVDSLLAIFDELPLPLQFGRESFRESVGDPDTILNTLRLNSSDGEIIGFAKGGPLENYRFCCGAEDEHGMCIHPGQPGCQGFLCCGTKDKNYGMYNTVFLEPMTLRMGYWGMRGGRKMRHLFALQSHSKQYKYLTSFALRDVIQSRIGKEQAEFVEKRDPQRWDYYRMRI